MTLETTGWSGEGAFTQRVVDALQTIDGVAFVRVEDAPASQTGVGFSFLCNEVFVRFETHHRIQHHRWLGLIPVQRKVCEPALRLSDLEAALAGRPGIGSADYSDENMLQFLRVERIVPPYQTRGYKQVEMVRIYSC